MTRRHGPAVAQVLRTATLSARPGADRAAPGPRTAGPSPRATQGEIVAPRAFWRSANSSRPAPHLLRSKRATLGSRSVPAPRKCA